MKEERRFVFNIAFICFSIYTFSIISSCKSQDIPASLIGTWNRVEHGQLIENEEYLENALNENCPSDKYIFLSSNKHIIKTYQFFNGKCHEEISERKYDYNDSIITVNNEKYIYKVKELNSKFLKLYLYKHEFSDSKSDNNESIFIYSFIKNK